MYTISQDKRGSSYIESPKWIKINKATINPQKTKDNRFFVCDNHCLEPSKNRKRPTKNIKNYTLYL